MTSIICVGDFGTGEEDQYNVSKLIEYLDTKSLCNFVIGLGDNIYPGGVRNVKDSQFKTKFEEPYKNLPERIKFYNCLGNHDYMGNTKSQIKYTDLSDRWILLDNYYCFFSKINDVTVDFFAIDTNLYQDTSINKKERDEQEKWLLKQLKTSNKRWKVVFGHHPWKSSGAHGDCNDLLDEFYNKIADTNKVDIILSGHDHDQQHLYIPNKPHLFISGTGGKTRFLDKYIRFLKSNEYLKYYSEKPGCLQIIPSKNNLEVNIWGTDKKENHEKAYTFSIEKN